MVIGQQIQQYQQIQQIQISAPPQLGVVAQAQPTANADVSLAPQPQSNHGETITEKMDGRYTAIASLLPNCAPLQL